MDSDYTCDPAKENYVLILEMDSLSYSCSEANSACEMQACLCDLELIRNLVSKISQVLVKNWIDLEVQIDSFTIN